MMEHFTSTTHDIAKEYSLKLEDVSDFLNVEASTIRDWIKAKKLPYTYVGRGLDMRFRMDDVIALVLK